VFGIRNGDGVPICEDGSSLFERNAVVAQVRGSFARIPLEIHATSLLGLSDGERICRVWLTALGFSRAVPSRAEAEFREFYAEHGAEASGQRAAPRRLLTRVGTPLRATIWPSEDLMDEARVRSAYVNRH